MKIEKYKYLLILLLLSFNSFSQTYKFNFWGLEQDLPEQFIYTINQDSCGFLWIGTGSGLAKFDGHSFEIFNETNYLPNNFISTSCIDKNNNIWFGFKNGQISVYDGKSFSTISISKNFTSVINDIKEDKNGNIIIASQSSGLAVISKNDKTTLLKNNIDDKQVYCVELLPDNKLLLGTNEGLFQYNIKNSQLQEISEIPMTGILAILKVNDNKYYIGTEDEGVHTLILKNNNFIIEQFNPEDQLDYYKIQNIYLDKNNNLWISTFGNGVYKYLYTENEMQYKNHTIFNQSNGLNSENVKTIYEDFEGNIWIGTYGEGLATLVDDFFAFYSNKIKNKTNNILSVFAEDKTVFLGAEGFLIKIDVDSIDVWNYLGAENGLPDDNITAIYKDVTGILWIGTEKNGLFSLNTITNTFVKTELSEDMLTNSINYIDGFGKNLWIATKNGLITLNKENGKLYVYNTENGLPHNNINHLFIDINENVWVATQSNDLYVITKGAIIKHKISNSNEILKINQIIRSNDSKIWIATYGNGVYSYDNKKFTRYSTNDGLKSNYCYSIMFDENRNIWVGHRQGISKIDPLGHIKTYGKPDGILGDCNKNAIYQDFDGCIWFGTTNGVVRYNYKKDKKNTIAPLINITSIKFSDQNISDFNKIEMPYGVYRLNIDFVGISFKDPDGVTYKYKLEGYDLEWNETNSKQIVYSRIEDGTYNFLLKSCNNDGICNETPIKLEIYVAPPIWKRSWFIGIVVIIILYSIYLIIKIREKNHKRLQEYLQKTLDERTKEVVEQKDKLEQANKDITDSINYAQRIQAAILPSTQILNQHFPQSFIYYLPRDIVSGDFYWFEKIKNKFVIICADATGHGVPGAFMSLISVTLIKDILKNNEYLPPAEILNILDKEIINTLKQKTSDIGINSSDGLDMTVCEIDINTNKLKVASAMRPILLYHNNELLYIKGNRYSIGGSIQTKKVFDNKEYDLNKNDILYLFSDGYADQFGGPNGKKMKLQRFKDIVNSIINKDTEEQFDIISKSFIEWKGEYKQIDDVIFMGIKI